jgi:hypothetical protein
MTKKQQSKPYSHDLDQTTINAENYLGKSEVSYIKSTEETNLDGFHVEPPETSAAPASAEGEDLSLEPHLKAGGQPGEPADKQVLIRLTESDRTRWGEAAKLEGVSVSEFVRSLVNDRVKGLLECPHAQQFRKVYNWPGRPVYSICSACGARL